MKMPGHHGTAGAVTGESAGQAKKADVAGAPSRGSAEGGPRFSPLASRLYLDTMVPAIRYALSAAGIVLTERCDRAFHREPSDARRENDSDESSWHEREFAFNAVDVADIRAVVQPLSLVAFTRSRLMRHEILLPHGQRAGTRRSLRRSASGAALRIRPWRTHSRPTGAIRANEYSRRTSTN